MHAYLFPALEKSSNLFSEIASRIDPERMDVPTHPGRFTPREVFAHLADWEPILREERMVSPIANPGCTVDAYDEGELAAAKNYRAWDVAESVSAFALERAKTIELLRSLDTSQWEAYFTHPERGNMTVYDMANLLVGHDMYHVEQLVSVL